MKEDVNNLAKEHQVSMKRIQYNIISIKDLMRQVDLKDKFMKCLTDYQSWRRISNES